MPHKATQQCLTDKVAIEVSQLDCDDSDDNRRHPETCKVHDKQQKLRSIDTPSQYSKPNQSYGAMRLREPDIRLTH